METQNVTLALPKDLLRRAKLVALEEGKSLSRLLTDLLKDSVNREDAYVSARERQLALLEGGLDLGTGGRLSWSRDDLHDR